MKAWIEGLGGTIEELPPEEVARIDAKRREAAKRSKQQQQQRKKKDESASPAAVTSPTSASPVNEAPANFDSLRELIAQPSSPLPQAAPETIDSSAIHAEVREQTKWLKAHSNALKQLPDATQKVVKSAVESATKKLAKDFAQSARAAFVEVNQQDLEPKLEEMVFRAVRETFQRSLIPAIEASVERMFSQIEDSMKVVVEKSTQNDSAKIDALGAQLRELTDMVRRLESSPSRGFAPAAEPAAPAAKPFTFEELRRWMHDEHRVSDAFEAALESRNVSLLEQLCEVCTPRDIATCSQAIVLCVVQQLSVDLPTLSQDANDEAGERLAMRMTWLKQCTLRLQLGDPTTKKHLLKTLATVRTNVDQAARNLMAQPQHDQLAMDMQLVVHVINSILGSSRSSSS